MEQIVPGQVLTDSQAMEHAIYVAGHGAGFVSPNPLVGCVILNSKNEFISSGYHAKYGTDHAEVSAIKNAKGESLEGSRVFVTLEPCSFEGNTPACAKTLSELPISEVIYAIKDPHPRVSGKGLEILKAKGIRVTHFSEFEESCEELAEVFFWNQRHKLPFVALKIATSLDGFIGLKSGESKWITGESSRVKGHYLRGCYDAVAVGVNTFLNDNPSLDPRVEPFKDVKNKVVLFDSKGRCADTLMQSNLLKVRSPDNVFVVSLVKKPKGLSEDINWIMGESHGESVDLRNALEQLYSNKIYSIYVEGGAALHASFVSNQLCQKLYKFTAPTLVGAKNGKPWLESWGAGSLDEKLSLDMRSVKTLDQDLFLTARFNF